MFLLLPQGAEVKGTAPDLDHPSPARPWASHGASVASLCVQHGWGDGDVHSRPV